MNKRNHRGQPARNVSALAVLGMLALGVLGGNTLSVFGQEAARDPRSREKAERRLLRWDLVWVKFEHWDFLKKEFVEGADGYGDPRRPKKWSITANSAHIDILNTSYAVDYNWSRPPDSILKGKPFRIRLALSVKGPLSSVLGLMPLMDVGSWLVRVVPETGKLGEAAVNGPLPLQVAIPEGMNQVVGEGPNMVGVKASGDNASPIGSDTEAQVEVQLQDTAKDFAFLAITANRCARMTCFYMETPVERMPDRSKTVWIDRDYGYPGCNTMLKGQNLRAGETYTVSFNGKTLLSRKVPQEIMDVNVLEETTPTTGYRSYSGTTAKRPNARGEIPPHEWVWIPSTTEAGTYYVQVDCSQSGKFELPFKVLPVSVEAERSNLKDIIGLFRQRIPENTALIRAIAEPGRLRDWVGRFGMGAFSLGAINNMFFAGAGGTPLIGALSGYSAEKFNAYTCGGYQGQVLAFLNYLRFNDAIYQRQLIDGLEFGPFQSEYACHHFAAIWPTHASNSAAALARWQDTAVILDPWVEQKPVTYDIKEYHLANAWKRLGMIQPDNAGPMGGDYFRGSYPVTGGSEYQDPFVAGASAYIYRDPVGRRVLIACPVVSLVTDAAGRRAGFLPGGELVNELGGTLFCREQESGERTCLFNLPPGTYRLEMTGNGVGKVNVACSSGTDAALFPEFTVRPSEKAVLATGQAASQWTLALPDGQTVVPTGFDLGLVMQFKVLLKGAPAGLAVWLRLKDQPPEAAIPASTDAAGNAEFVGLAPGAYLLDYPGSDGRNRSRDLALSLADTEAAFDW